MDYSTELKQRERQQVIIFEKHFSEIVRHHWRSRPAICSKRDCLEVTTDDIISQTNHRLFRRAVCEQIKMTLG